MLFYDGLAWDGVRLPTATFVKPGKSMSVKLTTAIILILRNQKDLSLVNTENDYIIIWINFIHEK